MAATTGDWVSREEHERVVDELRRANRRLSGTLQIVLDTLDSQNVATLFSRVLEEITDTMDAWGTLVYLAEPDGYHLRGVSESLGGVSVSRFFSFNRTLELLTTHAAKTLRLRVQPPDKDALRRGRLSVRDVMDEASGELHSLGVEALPPFISYYAIPVWFGSHVVALIEVGWRQVHPLSQQDADLLDAVAQYLSVQLVGAFSAMRTQREGRLRDASSQIREGLLSHDELTTEAVNAAFGHAAVELAAVAAPVHENAHQKTVVADLPNSGTRWVPVTLSSLAPATDAPEDAVSVVALPEGSDLSVWLDENGEPCIGALLDAGKVAGERRACLFLRRVGEEPFDDLELGFLRGVARDLVGAARGEEARTKDRRISQALQTGMRNELQHVEGITAEGRYLSATAAAFVGGDFYDLIRLPGRRACVIMGDVSGKGVEAASVSAAVKTALGAYSWEGLRPAHMVRLLNDFLLGFARLETFATLFVGVIDLGRRTLTYCSAGHPPALLVRSKRREVQMLEVQSGVVGAFHEMTYKNGTVTLSAGDILLLYTDGTTEARARDGRFFGEDGLRDAVARHASAGVPGICDALLGELDAFTDRTLEDDVALVALRFDEVG